MEPTAKKIYVALIIAAFVIPIAIMLFWNPQLGAFALILGIVIAMRSLSLLRSMQRNAALQDQQTLYARQNRARTIYVQLVDDAGNDLPDDIAKAKLTAANAAAGPRDIVVGVRHKI